VLGVAVGPHNAVLRHGTNLRCAYEVSWLGGQKQLREHKAEPPMRLRWTHFRLCCKKSV